MNSANLLMEFLSMSLIWVIIVGLVVVFIIIMLIVAIFNIDENTKAIRKILENNNGFAEREEAWIYEEKI